MTSFKIPADLADKEITIVQAREIIANRQQMKKVQKRIDALVAKDHALREELGKLKQREAELIEATQ